MGGGGTWYVLCHDTEPQYCLTYVSNVHSTACAGLTSSVHVPATLSLAGRNDAHREPINIIMPPASKYPIPGNTTYSYVV